MCGEDVWSVTAAVSTATLQTLPGLISVLESLRLVDVCPTGVQTVSGKRMWAPLFLPFYLFWNTLVVPVMGSASIQHQQSIFKWNWNPISTMLWYSQTSIMSFLTCHEPAHCWECCSLTNTAQAYTQICKLYWVNLIMIVLFAWCTVISRENTWRKVIEFKIVPWSKRAISGLDNLWSNYCYYLLHDYIECGLPIRYWADRLEVYLISSPRSDDIGYSFPKTLMDKWYK